MKRKNYINYLSLVAAFFLSGASYAEINISPTDTTSDIVNLRQNCTSVNNCATTFTELLDWVWNTRKPSASSPLLIDVGPGDFDTFFCRNTGTTDIGFVTVRGSGPNNSAIHNTKLNAVSITDCTNITFQDISILADLNNSRSFVAGIKWSGGGTSVWSNVQVKTTTTDGLTYGWYDTGSDCDGIHYWFGSKISVAARNGSYGYKSNCGETWFYGGDIEVHVDKDTPSDTAIIVINAQDDIRLFGTTVRAVFAPENTTNLAIAPSGFTGVSVTGLFHMHGGIINVDASRATSSFDVVGISGTSTSTAHTPMTAFRIHAGGNGNAIRVAGDNVESPYTWPKSATLPAVISTTGSDTFIETDCDSSGNCTDSTSAELHPHLMIYDASCSINGTWFDAVTNACRQ